MKLRVKLLPAKATTRLQQMTVEDRVWSIVFKRKSPILLTLPKFPWVNSIYLRKLLCMKMNKFKKLWKQTTGIKIDWIGKQTIVKTIDLMKY